MYICTSIYIYIYIRAYIHIYIKLPWPENPANMRHTEQQFRPYWVSAAVHTVISTSWRSNQRRQNAETELIPMGRQFIPHINDPKLTNHGKNARPHDHMYIFKVRF